MTWFDNEFTVDETRIARDENGRSYTVEGISYSEWKEKFVDGVDNSTENGTINYAKTIDLFLYEEDYIPANAPIT